MNASFQLMVIFVLLVDQIPEIQADAAVFIEPISQVSFEGEVSVFSCHSNESLFWQVNGEFYGFSQSPSFRGFEFSDTLIGSSVLSRVSITSSVDTNNTVINCLSVDNENNVIFSDNATLTVIGAPSYLKLHQIEDSTFTLKWEQPPTPVEYATYNYSITVHYQSDSSKPTTASYVVPTNNETEVYRVQVSIPADWLPLRECTQLIFSLVVNNKLGTSPPVTTTWENPYQEVGPLESATCSLKYTDEDDTMTALVLFTLPELCHYTRVSYSYRLTLAQTNSASVATSPVYTHNGGDSREIQGQLQNLKISIGNFYQIHVNAEVVETGEKISGPVIICTSPDIKLDHVNIGGLDSPEAGDQSPPEVLAGIVIGTLLLIVVLVMNIIVIAVAYKKRHSVKIQ